MISHLPVKLANLNLSRMQNARGPTYEQDTCGRCVAERKATNAPEQDTCGRCEAERCQSPERGLPRARACPSHVHVACDPAEKESSKRAQARPIRVLGQPYVERPCAFCAALGAPLGHAETTLAAIPREARENRDNRENRCENRLQNRRKP